MEVLDDKTAAEFSKGDHINGKDVAELLRLRGIESPVKLLGENEYSGKRD